MLFRVFTLSATLIAAGIAAPQNSYAQSAQQLQRDITKLEKEVNALQRRVFKGDTTYFPQNAASGAGPDAAGILVRLDQMEESLRQLTGRVEEMGYAQRQLEGAFKDFRDQTNYRLDALDGTNTPAAASTAVVADAAPTTSAVEPASDQADAAADQASTATALATPAEPSTPEDAFAKAFDLAKRDQFDAAEQAFLGFLSDYPKDPLASNGHYWLGRVYTAKKQLTDAADAFFNGYYNYPDGNKAPENLLALASTLRAMDSKKDACKALALLQSRIAENKYPSISQRVLQGIDNESSILACQ
ncbi:MAG: tol-pal system protein YbgF [Pseudomonadota bacterium]